MGRWQRSDEPGGRGRLYAFLVAGVLIGAGAVLVIGVLVVPSGGNKTTDDSNNLTGSGVARHAYNATADAIRYCWTNEGSDSDFVAAIKRFNSVSRRYPEGYWTEDDEIVTMRGLRAFMSKLLTECAVGARPGS